MLTLPRFCFLLLIIDRVRRTLPPVRELEVTDRFTSYASLIAAFLSMLWTWGVVFAVLLSMFWTCRALLTFS